MRALDTLHKRLQGKCLGKPLPIWYTFPKRCKLCTRVERLADRWDASSTARAGKMLMIAPAVDCSHDGASGNGSQPQEIIPLPGFDRLASYIHANPLNKLSN